MQIILLRSRTAAAKPLTLTSRHLLLALLGFVAVVILCSYLLSYMAVRHAADLKLPFVSDAAASS